MPWLKIDDSFTDHPKIEALSSDAFRLHVAGLCYCARTLSDGRIPEDRVRRLLPRVTKGWVAELVKTGLWVPTADGYEVYGYLDYNPSKEKVVNNRAAAAKRKADFLAKKAAKEAAKNAVPNGAENGVPNASRNGSPSQPNPTQPVGHWVGSGSTDVDASPSPSAGDAEEPHVVSPEVKAGIRAARNGLRAVPIVEGPEGAKDCPCGVPWADCVPSCPELARAIEARSGEAKESA